MAAVAAFFFELLQIRKDRFAPDLCQICKRGFGVCGRSGRQARSDACILRKMLQKEVIRLLPVQEDVLNAGGNKAVDVGANRIFDRSVRRTVDLTGENNV